VIFIEISRLIGYSIFKAQGMLPDIFQSVVLICMNSQTTGETKMVKKIGLLFSQSGTTSIVEKGQLQACLLAIEQVNTNNSILFEPIVGDAKSDPQTSAREAYHLFTNSKVDALVGCYTSACRKALLPVINETGGLALYPTVYEGRERHPNIFYCGAVPNQQIEPMLSWSINNLSDQFALIGSDYVYPRDTNEQVIRWVQRARGRIVLERYYPLGSDTFDDFFRELKRLHKFPSSLVVFSTLVGTSVVSFYREYKKRKLPFPIVSPITSELENKVMGKDASAGHYCTSAYFQSIDTETNSRFLKTFREHFGDEPIGREMESSYQAIFLLSEAYSRMRSSLPSGKNETERLRLTLKTLSFVAPQGKVIMDSDTQHLWLWSRIGQVKPDGNIEIVWTSPGPIPPYLPPENIPQFNSEDQELDNIRGFCSLVGRNRGFLKCVQMARIATSTTCNVLITGKSGTGKELFAKAIHQESDRSVHPFIPVNCAAIPRDLMASELFGYEEGSFTGAKKGGKLGKFELANGGTLFLDEIGEMPIDLQAHLLRAIEEKEIYRIGGTNPVHLDVRVIAATSKDLPQEIAAIGAFRCDLYYRLNVLNIDLPTLYERPEDIPILVNHFLLRLNCKSSKTKTFTPECLDILGNYSWPGNVRELANVVERAFHMAQDSRIIRPEHLPEHIVDSQWAMDDEGYDTNGILLYENTSHKINGLAPQRPEEIHQEAYGHTLSIKLNEERLIRRTIAESGYNISQASRLLGISRSTLYRKIKKYNISALQS
jgi:DNA-binding NtrC family response regulator/ABC-type branched-subunit amino acid transport system substrate-binding protein